MTKINPIWEDDVTLYRIAKEELFVALVGDILDTLGYQHQFLSPNIKPLNDDFVVIGRAMTVLEADTFEEAAKVTKNPWSEQLIKKAFEESVSTVDAYNKFGIM